LKFHSFLLHPHLTYEARNKFA